MRRSFAPTGAAPERNPASSHEKGEKCQELTSHANNAAVGANVAALANDHIGHGRVHDHAAPVDEGRAADLEADPIINVDRGLDKGRLGLQGRVGKRLIMCDGNTVLIAVTVWPDNTTESRCQWSLVVKERVPAQVGADVLKPFLAPLLWIRVLGRVVEDAACLGAAVPNCSEI